MAKRRTSTCKQLCTLMLLIGLAWALAHGAPVTSPQDPSPNEASPHEKSWNLQSGGVSYELAELDGHLVLKYFGPSALAPATSTLSGKQPRYDMSGQAGGESLDPSALHLVSESQRSIAPGVEQFTFMLHHLHLPLDIEARYTVWGDTGVFTRDLTLYNRGNSALSVASIPSLALTLGAGDYTLRYLWGRWGQERQLAVEKITAGGRTFGSDNGRSTDGYAPWLSLRNDSSGIEYLAELAWSGNWQMKVTRQPGATPSLMRDRDLTATMGVHFDFGGPLRIDPGRSFAAPRVAFTASSGDLDDVANQMHRYQRQYVFPRSSANRPLLVQFNSWYPFQGKMNVEEMKRSADSAGKLGAEVFVLDAGWYNRKDWSKELGDYVPDPKAFPHGLEELANYVRSKGMKFGLWIEIENIGPESHLYHEHSDWCLKYNGAILQSDDRCQLDFSKPEVRSWATATVNRLISQYGVAWLKIDYNINIGDRFDPHGEGRPGDVLYQQVVQYYSWLDTVRKAHPDLIIENCSSGGLRFDTGILAHTDTNWLSDNVNPIASLQLGYGCTLQFSPEVCNHWMVGDNDVGEVDLKSSPGWWDFMFRVPMNGQFGISSRIFDWNQALTDRAIANIKLYKEIRDVIADADVYHLTPEPAHLHPTGWMAIQYLSPATHDSVVTTYRLAGGSPTMSFRLRGLDPATVYEVSQDNGDAFPETGAQLANTGLQVHLAQEWRAAIFQLRKQASSQTRTRRTRNH